MVFENLFACFVKCSDCGEVEYNWSRAPTWFQIATIQFLPIHGAQQLVTIRYVGYPAGSNYDIIGQVSLT